MYDRRTGARLSMASPAGVLPGSVTVFNRSHYENVLVTRTRPRTLWPLPDMLPPQHRNGHLACDPGRLQVIWPAAHLSHPGGGAGRSESHTTGVESIIGSHRPSRSDPRRLRADPGCQAVGVTRQIRHRRRTRKGRAAVSAQPEDSFNQHDKRQQAHHGDADGGDGLEHGAILRRAQHT